jgi:hypothetical protein
MLSGGKELIPEGISGVELIPQVDKDRARDKVERK